ncbi:MAG: hypothetical protein CM15mV116_190 [uncultured marine virus]|nr:MAG: hypothetical protein CM15mV116_190 [uncultured marine virus]
MKKGKIIKFCQNQRRAQKRVYDLNSNQKKWDKGNTKPLKLLKGGRLISIKKKFFRCFFLLKVLLQFPFLESFFYLGKTFTRNEAAKKIFKILGVFFFTGNLLTFLDLGKRICVFTNPKEIMSFVN